MSRVTDTYLISRIIVNPRMFHKLGFYIDLRKIGDFCGITLCGGLEYQYTVD